MRTIEAHGGAADMVVNQAEQLGAELIVVGKRARNAAQRALLGSVSTKIVPDARCDVLVATGPGVPEGMAAPIVVGYDGSEHAERALERALELDGGEVIVVSAAHTTLPVHGSTSAAALVDVEAAEQSLKTAKELLAEQAIAPQLVEGHGDPADVIVEEARRVGAGTIVVGTRAGMR